MLLLGLAFLYIPLVMLVVYSFNGSQLVTVWGGFSTKWYGKLVQNDTILSATWLSLKIATASSLAAVSLGTLAGTRWRASNVSSAKPCFPVWYPHRW